MVRMTWHLATPQRLEPVGPERDCGTLTAADSSCGAGPASSEYHGGPILALRRRRWIGPASLSAG